MVIALDAMGGDFAPQSAIDGALLALDSMGEGEQIALIGNKEVIEYLIKEKGGDPARFIIHHAEEVIEMGENPTRALAAKPNSSIVVGYQLMAAGKIDAYCSAGNTGAMLVGAVLIMKTIPGILRPAIAGFVPKTNGSLGVLVDAGANSEVKPEFMAQFGELGALYVEYVEGRHSPKVALMNVGEEKSKGTDLTKAAYTLLSENTAINFVGNIEGKDVFSDKCDVIVADGFTGNVILKLSESVYDIMRERNLPADSFFDELNYQVHGGSPIIGINGNVIIGHGRSTPLAFKYMILQSRKLVRSDFTSKVKQALSVSARQD